MPYTKEELKDLAFYQNLINEDEQNYLIERERLQTLVAVSGSGYDGGLLTRDESGTIKLFENPYTGELYEGGPDSTLITNLFSDELKNDVTINEILDREIREL